MIWGTSWPRGRKGSQVRPWIVSVRFLSCDVIAKVSPGRKVHLSRFQRPQPLSPGPVVALHNRENSSLQGGRDKKEWALCKMT